MDKIHQVKELVLKTQPMVTIEDRLKDEVPSLIFYLGERGVQVGNEATLVYDNDDGSDYSFEPNPSAEFIAGFICGYLT